MSRQWYRYHKATNRKDKNKPLLIWVYISGGFLLPVENF